MSVSPFEISRNISQGASDLPIERVTLLDNAALMHGGRYGTLIHPEYATAFRKGVSWIMAGIVLGQTPPFELPGDTETNIFGYTDAEAILPDGQSTRILIPSLAKSKLPRVEGDPNNALHDYHIRLIEKTNEALNALESPYRLALLPVPPASGLVIS